jgi:hypothetical protein
MSKGSKEKQLLDKMLSRSQGLPNISKEPCPVCGAKLFENPAAEVWCTSSRCYFGLTTEATLSEARELNKLRELND